MLIDGSWAASIDTPTGPLEGDLLLTSEAGVLSGTVVQSGTELNIENGKINDCGDLSWTVEITIGMSMTAKVKAKYDGANNITGTVKLGFFGDLDLEAVRA